MMGIKIRTCVRTQSSTLSLFKQIEEFLKNINIHKMHRAERLNKMYVYNNGYEHKYVCACVKP